MTSLTSLQETVSASQRTFTARELRSGTDYLVTIIAQYPNSVGDSVSAKQRTSEWKSDECQQREIWQNVRQPLSHKTYASNVYNAVFSSYRVFARGLQSTSDPGRLLLSLCWLGSAFISCPGLQNHLWTPRSGIHTELCLYFLFVSVWLCLSPCLTFYQCFNTYSLFTTPPLLNIYLKQQNVRILVLNISIDCEEIPIYQVKNIFVLCCIDVFWSWYINQQGPGLKSSLSRQFKAAMLAV